MIPCCRASVHAAAPHASSSSRSAPRLRTRSDRPRPIAVAGLVALALLGLGEAAPAAFPVEVILEAHGASLQVTVEGGQPHTFSTISGPPWLGIQLEEPGPLDREYQVDGSDTTATSDRHLSPIGELLDSPLYRFDAWLRDESSYSRWEHVQVTDLATGAPVQRTGVVLPDNFRVQAGLRRPEAAARLWLLADGRGRREGLELNRDQRNARWVVQREGRVERAPRWFFPEAPAPFLAELLHLLGRSAAASFLLAVLAFALTRAAVLLTITPIRLRGFAARNLGTQASGRFIGNVLLAGWLLAAALVTTRLYHQLPHILDAVSYFFQAGVFASGRLSLEVPPLADAFKGPFEVVWRGRVFSQYPPGAPAAYAVGQLVGLEWLVGPVACAVLIGATSWAAGAMFGPACGFVVLCLGAVSPFVLFQAGSFLSHPIAAGLLAGALAAFVHAERRGGQRWYALVGGLLGLSFLSREAASVLFALPLAIRLAATRRWAATLTVVAVGLPFVLLYLLYNMALTGSPMLLPRTLFDPSDHFGFGDGVGFHQRHTLAAGLANTDELLTMLQFDLFGWPPLFAFALFGVTFLFGRAGSWDLLAALGGLAFVVAYTAYFYHGIALGSRYYFEAIPWLLLLAGRGAQVLAHLAGSRLAVAGVLGLLSLNTLLFYTPLDVARRLDLGGMPQGRRVNLSFVQPGVFGPRLDGVPDRSLVVTDDWWLYNSALAALNCGRVPDCRVLFALATTAEDRARLWAQYADRTLLRTVDRAGRIELVPVPGM